MFGPHWSLHTPHSVWHPDETADGILGELLPDLDLGIRVLLDSLWRYLAVLVSEVLSWIQVCGT